MIAVTLAVLLRVLGLPFHVSQAFLPMILQDLREA